MRGFAKFSIAIKTLLVFAFTAQLAIGSLHIDSDCDPVSSSSECISVLEHEVASVTGRVTLAPDSRSGLTSPCAIEQTTLGSTSRVLVKELDKPPDTFA